MLLFLAVIGGAIAFLFREQLMDEWRLWQFRRAAAAGDPDLPQSRERLLERLRATEVKLDLAARLAEDSDPKVRAAAVDVLLVDQPRARRQEAGEGLAAVAKYGVWRTRVREAVERLLEDDDETVRKKAIQAVSELEWASVFPDQLTGALKNGSEEERILVAAGLAHWNTSLLRQTIADANQPDKVRVAAMRSLDIYGDKEIAAWRDELRQALDTALQAKNEELRRAAIPALRYAQGSAYAWLALLDDDQQKEHHQAVLRTWADALDGETLSAMRRHWSETHEAWYRAGQAPRRWAVATYMMCEAAKMQMQQLDRTPPVPENAALADRQGPTGRAFDMQLTRLGNILSVVSAVRWYCNTDFNKDTEFTIWLPHETPKGRPPQRKLKSYMFQQVKPIWEWCLARQGAYSSRFLTADNIVRSYANRTGPQPVPPRPLGAVMDELLIGESEYQLLRKRYGEKQDGP